MSTVILTPTHIGQDHCVVDKVHPHYTKVDLSHKKIFFSPDKQFAYGTVGDFDPKIVGDKRTKAFIRLLIEVLKDNDFRNIKLDDEPILKAFDLTFDRGGHTLIVTSTSRHIMYYSEINDCIKIVPCGDYVGIGAGGDYAEGMLRAGADIHGIWERLNRLECVSSVAHSVFRIDNLKEFVSKERNKEEVKS